MSSHSGGALVESLSVALLIGLSGFLYLYSSYFKRFQLAAASQSTRTSLTFAYGLIFIILTSYVASNCIENNPSLNEALVGFWSKVSPFDSLPGEFGAAPVLGLLAGVASNILSLIRRSDEPFLKDKSHPLFTNNLQRRMRLAALSDLALITEDQMLRTLWRSLTLGKLIQVTLKNRKVYIGSPLASKDPSIESLWLKIVPIASGFRDDETLSYIPTTDYRELFNLLANANEVNPNIIDNQKIVVGQSNQSLMFDPNDVGIILPWAEITSLTIYDPTLEALFQVNNPS